MGGIKAGVLSLFNRFLKLARWSSRYLGFIFQLVIWMVVLGIMTPIFGSAFKSGIGSFGFDVQLSNSDFILLITAAFIIAYTYETRKIRKETVFQRRMASASDVSFRMERYYIVDNPEGSVFGKLTAPETLNGISEFTFLTPILMDPIGRCDKFSKITSEKRFFEANYFIKDSKGREDFLKALQLQNGEIKARVLTTNGERFIYTFKTQADNWKRAFGGEKNNLDNFILVKKEIDEF